MKILRRRRERKVQKAAAPEAKKLDELPLDPVSVHKELYVQLTQEGIERIDQMYPGEQHGVIFSRDTGVYTGSFYELLRVLGLKAKDTQALQKYCLSGFMYSAEAMRTPYTPRAVRTLEVLANVLMHSRRVFPQDRSTQVSELGEAFVAEHTGTCFTYGYEPRMHLYVQTGHTPADSFRVACLLWCPALTLPGARDLVLEVRRFIGDAGEEPSYLMYGEPLSRTASGHLTLGTDYVNSLLHEEVPEDSGRTFMQIVQEDGSHLPAHYKLRGYLGIGVPRESS